ncbi:MAG: NADH-quinone oxidoreductase subunit NuoE [bacterium]|nr:NADH-quinone oxidoreductase subunit NuoE [bacterium]
MDAKLDLTYVNMMLQDYKQKRGALIPVLQKIQEYYAYIPEAAVDLIAEGLNIPASEVYGVITFYAQFYTHPRGKHLIRVCRGTACHVKGSKTILEIIKDKLSIKEGDTTEDLLFTLETVGCLGACALAPVIVIDGYYYDKVTAQKIDDILNRLSQGNELQSHT